MVVRFFLRVVVIDDVGVGVFLDLSFLLLLLRCCYYAVAVTTLLMLL